MSNTFTPNTTRAITITLYANVSEAEANEIAYAAIKDACKNDDRIIDTDSFSDVLDEEDCA